MNLSNLACLLAIFTASVLVERNDGTFTYDARVNERFQFGEAKIWVNSDKEVQRVAKAADGSLVMNIAGDLRIASPLQTVSTQFINGAVTDFLFLAADVALVVFRNLFCLSRYNTRAVSVTHVAGSCDTSGHVDDHAKSARFVGPRSMTRNLLQPQRVFILDGDGSLREFDSETLAVNTLLSASSPVMLSATKLSSSDYQYIFIIAPTTVHKMDITSPDLAVSQLPTEIKSDLVFLARDLIIGPHTTTKIFTFHDTQDSSYQSVCSIPGITSRDCDLLSNKTILALLNDELVLQSIDGNVFSVPVKKQCPLNLNYFPPKDVELTIDSNLTAIRSSGVYMFLQYLTAPCKGWIKLIKLKYAKEPTECTQQQDFQLDSDKEVTTTKLPGLSLTISLESGTTYILNSEGDCILSVSATLSGEAAARFGISTSRLSNDEIISLAFIPSLLVASFLLFISFGFDKLKPYCWKKNTST